MGFANTIRNKAHDMYTNTTTTHTHTPNTARSLARPRSHKPTKRPTKKQNVCFSFRMVCNRALPHPQRSTVFAKLRMILREAAAAQQSYVCLAEFPLCCVLFGWFVYRFCVPLKHIVSVCMSVCVCV